MTITKKIEQGFGNGVNGLYDVLKWFNNMPVDADITVGAEGTNVINVAIQLKDYLGNNIAAPSYVRAYFCTTTAGTTKETTTVSTETAIGTDGEILIVTAKTEYMLLSEADGSIDIDITDTGTNDTYLAVVLPTGRIVVSDNIKFTT